MLAIRPSFDEIVHIPYSQLRHFGASQPSIALALIESGTGLTTFDWERVPALSRELVELLRWARQSIDSAADLERVENAAQEALRTMSAVSGKDLLATL